jgi:hypothetical protein
MELSAREALIRSAATLAYEMGVRGRPIGTRAEPPKGRSRPKKSSTDIITASSASLSIASR